MKCHICNTDNNINGCNNYTISLTPKEVKIKLLHNTATGNIIITLNNSSVILPKSLHSSLHNLFMEELKNK